MTLLEKLKQGNSYSDTSIVDRGVANKIEKLLNRTFYLPKKIYAETEFIKHVMTRGQDTAERVGLHASSLTKGDEKDYCYREQVLALTYKQNQGENVPPSLKRIFTEGDAIHEKWQRLFIRAGYTTPKECDRTREHDDYMVSFTPDIIATIPELFGGERICVEIKSMNTYTYKNSTEHTEGRKQNMFYMHMLGLKKGFVLAEDKNTQQFRCEYQEYDPDYVKIPIQRANRIIESWYDFVDSDYKHEALPKRHSLKDSDKCSKCNMRDACYNIGKGAIPIG